MCHCVPAADRGASILSILWPGLLSTVPCNYDVIVYCLQILAVKCPICDEVMRLENKNVTLLDSADSCRMTHYYRWCCLNRSWRKMMVGLMKHASILVNFYPKMNSCRYIDILKSLHLFRILRSNLNYIFGFHITPDATRESHSTHVTFYSPALYWRAKYSLPHHVFSSVNSNIISFIYIFFLLLDTHYNLFKYR